MNPRALLRVAVLSCVPAALLGFALFLSGCATASRKPGSEVFFPPAPDQPRIQYLTSFSSEGEYSGKGGFKNFIVGAGTVFRPIWKPYGITATPGMLYVADTQGRNIAVLDLGKKRLRYLKPDGPGTLKLPINIAVDADGTKYISDTARSEVLLFSAKDEFQGPLPGTEGMRPCGLALAGDRIYITDLSNRCVKVFSKASKQLVLTVPQGEVNETNRLRQPTNIALDSQGRIYVSDTAGFAIQVYDPQGQFVRTIGDLGARPGAFALPKGIAVDRQDRLYVVDAATGVIQIFDKDGQVLMYFAGPTSPAGAASYLPAGIWVDYDNVKHFQSFVAPGRQVEYLIFVTNQAGDRKVSVYGFLKQ